MMIESRVRNALGLLADTQESWGYPAVAPEMLDEMAVFCSQFPEGSAEDFWTFHLANISERYAGS